MKPLTRSLRSVDRFIIYDWDPYNNVRKSLVRKTKNQCEIIDSLYFHRYRN